MLEGGGGCRWCVRGGGLRRCVRGAEWGVLEGLRGVVC